MHGNEQVHAVIKHGVLNGTEPTKRREILCDPAYEAVARHNVRVTGTDIEVEI